MARRAGLLTRLGAAAVLATALAAMGDSNLPQDRAGVQAEAPSYFHARRYLNLGIPKARLPSPGHCQVWFPGKAADQQPREGKCVRVGRDVPLGAWLIARPSAEPGTVRVQVYDEQSAGVVVATGIFDFETGEFLRNVSP